MRYVRYIGWFILMLAAGKLAGQGVDVIDNVCSGDAFHYRVHGEEGSTYLWELTHPDGTYEYLESDADTILIHWDYEPGVYRLTVMQFNEDWYCEAIPREGDVIIHGCLIRRLPITSRPASTARNTAPAPFHRKAAPLSGIPLKMDTKKPVLRQPPYPELTSHGPLRWTMTWDVKAASAPWSRWRSTKNRRCRWQKT